MIDCRISCPYLGRSTPRKAPVFPTKAISTSSPCSSQPRSAQPPPTGHEKNGLNPSKPSSSILDSTRIRLAMKQDFAKRSSARSGPSRLSRRGRASKPVGSIANFRHDDTKSVCMKKELGVTANTDGKEFWAREPGNLRHGWLRTSRVLHPLRVRDSREEPDPGRSVEAVDRILEAATDGSSQGSHD
jgi:hypothetical protein